MNHNSENGAGGSPILIVPYMWIGDFVRCHSVVKLLRTRFPDRPIDMLATTLCAPLADYMPGLRQAIVADLPRSRLALAEQFALGNRLKREGYGTALVMPRTWKSALAPFFAGIPERTGFAGEARFIPAQRCAFRRAPPAAHGRPLCRAGAAGARPNCRRNGRCRNSKFLAMRSRPGARSAG